MAGIIKVGRLLAVARAAASGGGGDIPDNALVLNGSYLQLDGKYLVLGA